MLGTNGVGGGTTTKALALSKVVRTRLKVFGAGWDEIWEGNGDADTRRFCNASRSVGDAERDVEAVHEDVVDEMELCRLRRQRANSFC